MTLRAASDLITKLRTIDMTNVTALTNRPVIRLAGLEDSSGDSESGELILLGEKYRPLPLTNAVRHQRTVIPATYEFSGTSEITIKQIIEDFDRLLRVPSKPYVYEMEYDWDTNVDAGVVFITFTVTKKFVVINT